MSNLPSTKKASSWWRRQVSALHSALETVTRSVHVLMFVESTADVWLYPAVFVKVPLIFFFAMVTGTLQARSLSAINFTPVVWKRLIISGKSFNQLNKIIAISVFPPLFTDPDFLLCCVIHPQQFQTAVIPLTPKLRDSECAVFVQTESQTCCFSSVFWATVL